MIPMGFALRTLLILLVVPTASASIPAADEALDSAFTNCCYLLDLWVYDASIRHAFDRVVATDVSGDYYAYQPITFAAGP